MTPSNEKELWQFIGEIRTDIKNIKDRFDGLPCGNHGKRLSKVEGKMTTISVISGFIGSIIFALVGWILNRIKF